MDGFHSRRRTGVERRRGGGGEAGSCPGAKAKTAEWNYSCSIVYNGEDKWIKPSAHGSQFICHRTRTRVAARPPARPPGHVCVPKVARPWHPATLQRFSRLVPCSLVPRRFADRYGKRCSLSSPRTIVSMRVVSNAWVLRSIGKFEEIRGILEVWVWKILEENEWYSTKYRNSEVLGWVKLVW